MNELSFNFNSIIINILVFNDRSILCHVYKLKVSQDHTNSAIENDIELPVFP